VDERAFRNYKPAYKNGGPRHKPGTEDTKDAIMLESQATNYEKRKLIETFSGIGNIAQKRLVLRNFLCDPQIKDIAASIGIDFEQDRVGQHILEQWRKIMYRAQNTTNKNHTVYQMIGMP
jgi:hypothetical protein